MKIIVATDFSENANNALEFGIALAEKKGGKIILVHAIEPVLDPLVQGALGMEKIHDDAKALMEDTIAMHPHANLEFEYIIQEGTASLLVSRTAREINALLVVVGTQGTSGILNTLIGSTTINLIKACSVPILVVPSESLAMQVQRIVLGLEFTDRENKFIDWAIDMSQRWGRRLEFVHVQTKDDFEEEAGLLKLEKYVLENHQGIPMKIHTFYATTPVEGLDQFLEENENVILVMCHEHKNLWEQILSRSQTIEMLFHSKVPLLIMP
jgi:nucleotide-binding universal stress UspA family protein